MEKFVSEYVCDFCGIKCERGYYIFPVIETESQYAMNKKGQKLLKIDKQHIVPKQVDMCPTCKVKVARFIDLARYVDIKEVKDYIYDTAVGMAGR